MNPIIKLWNFITGKVEIPNYPVPFGIITKSPEGIERGLNDDQNKIIIHYFYNRFGNLCQEIIPYSPEIVYSMEKVRKIPIIDKTEATEKYPIFSRINPQEVSYETNG